MAAELARKAQAERRGMLEADSESWVRVLLTETRREAAANAGFLGEIDQLDASRQALATRMREQSAFISVLQHNLQKEARERQIETAARLRPVARVCRRPAPASPFLLRERTGSG